MLVFLNFVFTHKKSIAFRYEAMDFCFNKTAILCYKPYSAALVFTSISYDGIAQQ